MKIVVGSTNLAKVNAVKEVFRNTQKLKVSPYLLESVTNRFLTMKRFTVR